MNLKRKTKLLMMTVAAFSALVANAQSAETQNSPQADTAFQGPMMRWDRSSAMASAQAIDVGPAVNQLKTAAALKDGQGTVKQLKFLSTRVDWPAPARELALYEFTRSLADQSAAAVDPAILDFLTAYQPQVLVTGNEHASDLRPLFNIRSAATGVENHWLRLSSAEQARYIINSRPSDFLVMFAQAQSPAVKSGYLDGLRQVDIDSIREISLQASAQLQATPELSAVVAIAVQAGIQSEATHRLLIEGKGPQLASTMREMATHINRAQLAKLLQLTIEKAPAENAALAIASWWPVLSTDHDSRQLLLNILADPQLGAAAALALADKPNVQTILELQQLAKGSSLTAKRAQMSLDINRLALVQEQQQ